MCFSVQVDKDIKKLSKRFGAKVSETSSSHVLGLKEKELSYGPLKTKEVLGLKRKPSSSFFKESDEHGRIYPNYFAPVIVFENGNRVIKQMRYRVRPHNSAEEIPSKYNVFNARIDALEKRKTWNKIFLKNHCLFPFTKFYEWVEDKSGKKKLINFSPDNFEVMWAPAIYDTWTSSNKEISFSSFALITDNPPPEIEEMGHDRCPIFLKENLIDKWLQPDDLNKEAAYKILSSIEEVQYSHKFISKTG